jgi:serine protease Do
MRRIVLTLIVAASLAVSLEAASQWVAVAAKVEKAIVTIGEADTHCTGFVIDGEAGPKGELDTVLTADHCDVKGKLLADNMPARVVYKDAKKDLLVVQIEDTERPALRLAKDNPKIGEEVASYGYGFALERPMFRVTHIADDRTYIPEDGIGGPFMVTDAVFVGGQSGGPVVNAAGEVVMIVQRGGSGVGLGVGAEVIKQKVGRYFGKITATP